MNIIAQIDTRNLSVDECFSIAMSCSKLLSSGDSNDEREARIIVIHILNNWKKVPSELYPIWTKAFRVIDSLQRYVCDQHGKKAGSYSYFVQQLENDFIRENLSILIEYGIPSDTVHRISRLIPVELDEDGVIEYIKLHKDIIYKELMQYEIDRLNQAL